ncbi:unnamed protein product [Closterium sp. Naga37s-1]|nr:unnamed protein product [Closterium sp. Naga37s-1]
MLWSALHHLFTTSSFLFLPLTLCSCRLPLILTPQPIARLHALTAASSHILLTGAATAAVILLSNLLQSHSHGRRICFKEIPCSSPLLIPSTHSSLLSSCPMPSPFVPPLSFDPSPLPFDPPLSRSTLPSPVRPSPPARLPAHCLRSVLCLLPPLGSHESKSP